VNHNLLDGLEALRNLAGVAVVVNAGYRCPQHNQEVGGVPNSDPTRGLAADIHLPDCHGSGCTNSHWRFHNLRRVVLPPMTAISCTSMFAITVRAGLRAW